MPTENLIVMGSSLINNPIGYSQDPWGNANDGAYITGGDSVFDDDDVIVFTVQKVNNDGTFDNQTQIMGIEVYDNAADYVNGVPKYTYELEKTGGLGWGHNTGSGDVSTTVHNMGDAYLHFPADGFVSSDPGAPDLDYLFLAPGVDLSEAYPVWLSHETSIDYDENGNITGSEVGDGVFTVDNNLFAENEIAAAICLTRGTLIDTPEGPKFIETLSEGDLVHTLDDGPQPIRWIGSRRVEATGKLAPIRIKAGALGNFRDLTVSPNHRMMIRGPKAEMLFGERDVLVAAKHLVNDDTIRRVPGGTVDYFHMLFDSHQIIFAEGCPTESLYPGQEALGAVDPEARAEILTLFPDFEHGPQQTELSRYELKAWEAQALRHAS